MLERTQDFRQAVRLVALFNLAYFGVEFAVALSIGSVSLFADSIDFLEDASVNFLIVIALTWPVLWRARLGKAMALILLVPSLAAVWVAYQKIGHFVPPTAGPLTLTGVGALIVNVGCAFILVGHRHRSGSLSRAAFLSARNDAFANIAIIAAGTITALYPSAWPDLIVGIGIAIMNADAAREIWEAASKEHLTAEA
ncbi:cation transporter [Parvibaculum sp. MBR-TMA-1.3b-4.2]|jgi:Co/Zn/Cd efflux system component